jgi:ligand-binding sensor domain-containing protein/signal transduction histidine kinase/DNA-binding response OmpR family regulator
MMNCRHHPARGITSASLALTLAALLALACPSRARAVGDLFDPATNLIFEHITVDEGLPENSVRAIVQDQTGFLWLGTQNGLVRFDGTDMRVFSPRPEDPTAFGGRTIEALLEDSRGTIWIGTFLRGLWRLDPERGDFTHVDLAADRDPGATLHVRDISEDAEGRLWIGTHLGLVSLDRGGAIRWHDAAIPADSPTRTIDINSTMADRQGRVWCGTEGQGVLLYRPVTGDVRQFRHDADRPTSLADNVVRDIVEDGQGRIWLATDSGLGLWRESSGDFVNYRPAPDSPIMEENLCVRIAPDRQGLLWIGSASGLYVFDPVLARFRLFAHNRNEPHSLVNGPILSLLIDRSGLLWAGSWHTGLNKANPAGGWFRTQEFSAPDLRLESMAVDALWEDGSGALWVGASEYPRGRGRGRLYRREPGSASYAVIPAAPAAAEPLPGILSLLDEPDGSVWVGTQRGLWRATATRVAPFTAGSGLDAERLARTSVKAMARDAAGRLWLATSSGLFRWDAERGQLTRFVHDAARPNSLTANDAVSISIDAAGRLWVGTDLNGLNLYLSDEEGFRRFENPDRGLETVSDIHETRKGEMWLATFSGLIRFDRDSGRTEILDRSGGLPNDEVASLLEDNDGFLWVSTGYGLARVDPRTRLSSKYDVRDGLPDNEVRFAAVRGRDGQLHFGGSRGMVSFRPELFNPSNVVPAVVITGIAVSDELLDPKPGSYLEALPHRTNRLELPHGANDVAFRFAALDLGRPDRNQYRFRLEGVDDDWRVPRGEPVASYTNLAPGSYTFQVQGTNRDGVWNESGAVLDLRILPPWWDTTWAHLLYLLAAALLALLVYRQLTMRHRLQIKIEVQRAEAAKLQELDNLKSRFLTNITHEFRTPLTLIKVPLQRLQSEEQNAGDERFRIMLRNAGRLEQLIDQLLDLARLEAGRLPLRWQYGDCIAFLRLFANSLRSLPAQRHIAYEIVSDSEPVHAWHDQDLLEKVIGNLVVNAVKHTPDGGSVRVGLAVGEAGPAARPRSVETDADDVPTTARPLVITVTNTGSFIPPHEVTRIFDRFHQVASTEGFGVGLALVRELTDLLGGSVTVASDETRGTTFTVTLPLYAESPTGEATPALPAEGEAAPSSEPAEAEDEDAESDADAGSDEPCVLIVEDQLDLLEFMAGDLKDEYRVLKAVDGRAGLKLAIDEIPDLVLSDVMMPGLNGFELCEALKQDERTSHIPVILLTARSDVESRHEGLRLGADDYLGKPFDLEDLRLRIHNLVEQRRRLAESYQRRLATLAPDMMPVTSSDERFILQLRQAIDARLDDEEFRITELCREVGMSRSQLHRKLRAVTGKSATEFVRTHRLQRAAQLFDGGYGNVTEVAYAVGFQNLSYFSRSFRDLYEVQPSEYLKRHKDKPS